MSYEVSNSLHLDTAIGRVEVQPHAIIIYVKNIKQTIANAFWIGR